MIGQDAKLVIGADVKGAVDGIKQIQTAMPGFASAVAGGFSIAAVTAFVKTAINAADELSKLSQKTGVAVDQLAGFKFAAEQNGTTLEALSGGFKRLSTYMVENSDKLRKIGIDAKTADGAMLQLADLFRDMPNGVQKSALAVELFGKAGTDLIPMLNQGAAGLKDFVDRGKEYNPITEDMAKNAEAFNDNLDIMKTRAAGLATVMANELLQALVPISAELAKTDASGQSLAKTFGGGVAEVLKTVVVLASEVAFVFRGIGTEIGGIAAQITAAASGDFKRAADIGAMMREDAAAARAAQDAYTAGIMGGGGAASSPAFQASAAAQAAALGRASSLTGKPGKAGKAGKTADEYQPGIYDGEGSYEMGSAFGEDPARAALLARLAQRISDIQAGHLTEMELLQQNHDERITAIMDMQTAAQEQEYATYEDRVAAEQYYNSLIEEEQGRHIIELEMANQRKLATDTAYANAKRQVDQLMLGGVAQAAQQLYQLMTMAGLKHTALAKAMFLAMQGAQVAQIVLQANTSAAATQAGLIQAAAMTASMMGPAGPAYFKAAMADAIATGESVRAMGYVNAGLAAAIGIGEMIQGGKGGGGGAVGGGGGGAFANVGTPTTFGGVEQPPQAPQLGQVEAARNVVNVTLVGSAFDYKTVAGELIPILNEAAGNGIDIRVNAG